ncbi:hypothetical protein L332_05410 [Agrococcus pavilionensis RW1]|uniref:Integral membrane protein n=1 Tax=Agrococcus pavilionensis RW1 TaxID=1330458 RepID=U1MPR3_9MICO|nr:hypothetical protein [Agrococcus pavilionensis]ERG63906.1 hypothetical protein L332_05410 [Agrococcus pavilionensis RW1]
MTRATFRIPELGIALPLSRTGVRGIALAQLLLVTGVLSAAAATDVAPELRVASTWLTLAASACALATSVPALVDGRFRFALAGAGSAVTALVAMTLVGLVRTWPAHLFGWPLLAVSMLAVAYHLVGSGHRAAGRSREP